MKLYNLLLTCILATLLLGCQKSNSLQPGEGFVKVTGGKIWYRIIGQGDKNPIVMLHGGPGYPSYYLNPLAALSKDRPIVLFDQLGCGRSDRISDTTLMTMASYVEHTQELLKELNIREFYLYGHSSGTMLGVDYYLKHPKGIKALILASPVLSTTKYLEDLDAAVAMLPDSIQQVINTTKATKEWQSPQFQKAWNIFFSEFFLRKQEADANLDSANKQAAFEISQYMWGPSEFSATGNLKSYERCNDLKKINIPILYTRGELEAIQNSAKHYQTLTPHSQSAVIPNAAHFTMIDNPQAELEIIAGFIKALENK